MDVKKHGGIFMMTRYRLASLWCCTTLVCLLALNSCAESPATPEPDVLELFVNSATEMGTPYDADPSDDVVIRRFQYTLSYHPGNNVANWVAWNEDSAWYGAAKRCDCFANDPLLPYGLPRVHDSIYTGSGYDRGHIVGSAARTRSDSDNKATFFYTNIFPQTPDLNRETWYSLERTCDSLCTKANKELYIIAGGIYKSGRRLKNTIAIPDSCWKVVLVLERGQRLRHVRRTTPVIAVIMNNGTYTTSNNDWRLYRTTVRAIEQSTGYNLLSNVSRDIQDVIETTIQ